MLPFNVWRNARLDLRNHRKIAIIDGQVGFTGSQNLVDPEFAPGRVYEDLVVRVTGPVVMELQHVFVADWFKETGEVLDSETDFPSPLLAGGIPAQVLPSGPAFPNQNNQRLFVALVHGARSRVILTTPYFVPDEPMLQAIQTAALRGVEVHLVVSEHGDKTVVTLAQESYFEELLETGVQIHQYKTNLLHAKHLSIDDSVAVIGTSNLDIRSFALNKEVMLIVYDHDVAAQLGTEEERYFASSNSVTLAEWGQRPFGRKVSQNLARLLSPLL
jgi:cardiolipin synthase